MLYTVYGLHEAGKPDDIQYIGVTGDAIESRLVAHRSARRGGLPVNRWIASVMESGKQIACRILMQTECAGVAHQMEETMIVFFAERDGPLHNVECNPRYLDKALADLGEAVRAIQAKVKDGSLDIQSFLSGQN